MSNTTSDSRVAETLYGQACGNGQRIISMHAMQKSAGHRAAIDSTLIFR
jgi:hypothetical protein